MRCERALWQARRLTAVASKSLRSLLGALVASSLLVAGPLGCGGGGDDAATGDAAPTIDAGLDGAACDPDRPVASPPDIFIGPADLERQVGVQIDGATRSIDLQMYAFTRTGIITKLIAADRRGVPVRVILDQSQRAANTNAFDDLQAGRVDVKWSSTGFPAAHAKYLVVDGDTAMIMSGNLTTAGMVDQRNAGLVDRDPTNVADLAAVFAADWAGTPAQLQCPRLVISPADARTRVLGLIAAARTTLDIEVYYIADVGVRTAIVAAKNRGVAVRVILADPAEVTDNSTTASALKTAGVPVRTLARPVPHIKLIVVDGAAALVGSHNLSNVSLRDNREIGEIVRTPAAVTVLRTRLDGDWALATPW